VRSAIRSILTSVVVVAALMAVPRPAAAYDPDPSVYWITQNAGTCNKILGEYPGDLFTWGDLAGAGCYINGTAPDVIFGLDAGGHNAVFELWAYRGGMIGEIVFKALGEWLYIADTANDGDTFYVWIDGHGPYFVQGTSNPTDDNFFDLDFAEGSTHVIKITDDKDGHDVIASSTTTLPYLVG
jgi:hypothetical protein